MRRWERSSKGPDFHFTEGRTVFQKPRAGAKSFTTMFRALSGHACVSKGAEGWESVGLSVLLGEHWGSSLPGREIPLSGWVNVHHQHSNVS